MKEGIITNDIKVDENIFKILKEKEIEIQNKVLTIKKTYHFDDNLEVFKCWMFRKEGNWNKDLFFKFFVEFQNFFINDINDAKPVGVVIFSRYIDSGAYVSLYDGKDEFKIRKAKIKALDTISIPLNEGLSSENKENIYLYILRQSEKNKFSKKAKVISLFSKE